MAIIKNSFLKATLADGDWNNVIDLFSNLPDEVREIQIRNTSNAMEIRNSSETTLIESYAINDIYKLKFCEGIKFDISELQIKATATDVILGEFMP